MVSHMKTTLNIDDRVLQRLEHVAAREGRTMSEIVEAALWLYFKKTARSRQSSPMPDFDLGAERVDIADRDALYRALEEE